MHKKPVVLIIRDGWGDNPNFDQGEEGIKIAKKIGDCPRLANTPFTDEMLKKYPFSHVSCSGLDVGLPEGQMGNSEVGHLNLGAGRVVYQDLTKINKSISGGTFSEIKTLKESFKKSKSSKLHLIGLISPGGVHSHQDHLVALCKEAKDFGVKDIMIHGFTDGRDSSPTGSVNFFKKLESEIENTGAIISTVVGRYFGMDRDNRWDRIKLSWDAIVYGEGEKCDNKPSEAILNEYKNGQTDEFMKPMIFSLHKEQRIKDNDVVIFFNFRADRARQLTKAFIEDDFSEFPRGKGNDDNTYPKVNFYAMTQYDEKYNCDVIFPPDELNNTFGEVVSKQGLSQFRIAETEKYPHVSFFFNGGVEEENEGEFRQVLPSLKDVKTYDEKPEMSAKNVTEAILQKIHLYDVAIINFANPDMVGHTGNVDATIKAVEFVDKCVKKVVDKVLDLGGKLLIGADHGNCEEMITSNGEPQTAHTTNLVHFFYVSDDANDWVLKDGKLCDISPTLLEMLNIEKPNEMTGYSLLLKK